MAETLGSLSPDDQQMFMPMRELSEANRAEVYEAAGADLCIRRSLLTEDYAGEGCYLVRLDDGRKVAFPFITGRIEGVN